MNVAKIGCNRRAIYKQGLRCARLQYFLTNERFFNLI